VTVDRAAVARAVVSSSAAAAAARLAAIGDPPLAAYRVHTAAVAVSSSSMRAVAKPSSHPVRDHTSLCLEQLTHNGD